MAGFTQFGRTLLNTNIVQPTRVCADGRPEYKVGGITIDPTTLPAAPAADVTLPDGSIIRAGNQYLRYGQVMCKITGGSQEVVTLNGVPTGGTFTISVTGGGSTQTTTALAYNASAATVQTAVRALSNVDAATTVGGSAGGPYTIVFPTADAGYAVSASGASLTGGTSPSATVAPTVAGGNAGMYGPYDPAAIDGRQTLTPGECVILDETWFVNPAIVPGLGSINTIGGCLVGGYCWIDRIVQSGTASHSLAAGPTRAELMAAFPRLLPVEQ